jgi:hypothetical protein
MECWGRITGRVLSSGVLSTGEFVTVRTYAKSFQLDALTQTVQTYGKSEQRRWGGFAKVQTASVLTRDADRADAGGS